MLEVFVNFICSLLMSLVGFILIKKITNSNEVITKRSNLFYISLLIIISTMLCKEEYSGIHSVIVYLLNIVIYKSVFKLTLEDGIISNSISTIIMFIADLITASIFRLFIDIRTIRTDLLIYTVTNIVVCMVSLIIINLKIIRKQIDKFYNHSKNKSSLINIIFFCLLILAFSIIAYNLTVSNTLQFDHVINTIIMLIFAAITYIFVKNQNNYNQLSDEYDSMFSYVQTFEDWIEREQLNRHEYKNQLAVLRCLTKEKKVKNKIDEILEDNINIEGDVVHQLKVLPKGGIKGLMYYKVALAQKQKINVEVNVSLAPKSELGKLKEKDIRVLCKLIGIYLDNAIEAAVEPRKKNILIEVYEIKDKVTFVCSNTFKKHQNFNNRNKKGVSSKGEGRGNGLYFASNLISRNKWLTQKQEIIDGYYIQQLIITKRTKNKSHH